MDEDIAIKVDGVSKDFILVHEKKGTIKGIFTSMFRKVTIKKETQHALKDISFTIKKGEFFGIVGRNGSGKSTMLKILAGIYQPTKGSIEINGRLVPFIELGVGFNPELSGRDNVYLNGAVLGFSSKQVDKMYDEIVEFAELERFMDQKLKNYSSGMQVRLAFSMAVRANADILLIDEVLAVGDADFQRKCFEYFKKIKKNKKTVVFVSHDMEAVREYCDRAVLIESSKVVKMGLSDDIAQLYSRLFMTDKPSNRTEENKAVELNGANSGRWGNGKVKIGKVDLKVNANEIVIIQVLKAINNIAHPVVGIRLRDAAGKSLTGTNSKLERKRCPTIPAGKNLVITWRLPNIFSDGTYLVDLAVHEADSITVCDWWDEAASFSVQKMRHIPYVIAPDIHLAYDLRD